MSTAPQQWLFNLVYAFLSLQVRLEEVYTTFEVQLVTCLAFCATLEDWSRLWQMSGRNQVQVKRYGWMRCHVLGSNSFLALRTIDKLFNWTEDHPEKCFLFQAVRYTYFHFLFEGCWHRTILSTFPDLMVQPEKPMETYHLISIVFFYIHGLKQNARIRVIH